MYGGGSKVWVGDCKAKVIDGLEAAAKPADGFVLIRLGSWGSIHRFIQYYLNNEGKITQTI